MRILSKKTTVGKTTFTTILILSENPDVFNVLGIRPMERRWKLRIMHRRNDLDSELVIEEVFKRKDEWMTTKNKNECTIQLQRQSGSVFIRDIRPVTPTDEK
jgi:hypothetical protein